MAYVSIELDNGAILTAETDKFDKVFLRENIESNSGEAQFITTGLIVDRRIKNRKP